MEKNEQQWIFFQDNGNSAEQYKQRVRTAF